MTNHTSTSQTNRPHVTDMAFALIRGLDMSRVELLKLTAPIYGHSNREVIGRACANTLDRLA